MAGSLADAAVDHHVVVGTQPGLAEVDGLQLDAGTEGGILGGGAGPRNALRARDVAAAQGAFLRVIGHVQQLAAVLPRRPHVDHRLAEVFQDLVLERPDVRVVAVDNRVVGLRALGLLGAERPALGDPLGPPAVHQAHVGVPEQRAHPQGVRGPPVVPVAVEHQRGVAADALVRHQPGEARAVDVVARNGVVELGVPVELDRAGDVTGLVQQHVLIGLGYHQARIIEVLRHPLGGDDHFGVGVFLQLSRGIIGQRHGQPHLCSVRSTSSHQGLNAVPRHRLPGGACRPRSDETLVDVAPSPARSRLQACRERVVGLLVVRPGVPVG